MQLKWTELVAIVNKLIINITGKYNVMGELRTSDSKF